MEEKRKHTRINTENLLSYEGLDENGNTTDRGMGKTINISQGGLLMETPVPVKAKFILLISLSVKEEPIKIKGKVVYSTKAAAKKFHTGVHFIETNEKINVVIKEIIKDFIYKKKNN